MLTMLNRSCSNCIHTQSVATKSPEPKQIGQAAPKHLSRLLPSPVALGLWLHGSTKPLCQIAKAQRDYTNQYNRKPVVVKQEAWEKSPKRLLIH